MQFRPTSVSDIDRIMNILNDGRQALAALGIDQWQGGYPYRHIVEDDVRRGDSYVVLDADGEIVATAMMGFSGERDYDLIKAGTWLTPSFSHDSCYCVVHRVAVAHTCKGRGVASFLLENAERLTRARGCASVRIDTHPGNEPMRHLLKKLNYQECGTIYIAHAEGANPERIAYEKLV